MVCLDKLDELHRDKENLSLRITSTINISQQVIARSVRVSREVKELIKKYSVDSVSEQNKK